MSEALLRSLVMQWNISVRQAAKCLLLMNAHILSHIPVTSSRCRSARLSGIGTPKDAKTALHSSASESKASDIWNNGV